MCTGLLQSRAVGGLVFIGAVELLLGMICQTQDALRPVESFPRVGGVHHERVRLTRALVVCVRDRMLHPSACTVGTATEIQKLDDVLLDHHPYSGRARAQQTKRPEIPTPRAAHPSCTPRTWEIHNHISPR